MWKYSTLTNVISIMKDPTYKREKIGIEPLWCTSGWIKKPLSFSAYALGYYSCIVGKGKWLNYWTNMFRYCRGYAPDWPFAQNMHHKREVLVGHQWISLFTLFFQVLDSSSRRKNQVYKGSVSTVVNWEESSIKLDCSACNDCQEAIACS